MKRTIALLLAALLVAAGSLSPTLAIEPNGKRIVLLNGQPKPVLDLNLAAARVFPSIVTFSRLSTARGFNSAGLLTTAGANQPRFVYDSGTLVSLGFLSELGATNIQLHSQFDSGWTAGGGALVASNATSPDGTVDGATFTEDGTTGNHDIFLTAGTSVTANTVYTSSVFLKAGTRSTVTLSFEVSGPTSAIRCNVDLNAGTVSAGSVVGSGVISGTPTIQALSNGWYRVFLAGTVDAASTTAFLVVYGASPAGTISYTGTSATFLAFGADIKIGLDYSSYIPTTTASASRAADVATMVLSSTGVPASPAAMTIIGKFTTPMGFDSNKIYGITEIDDGTSNNRTIIQLTSLAGNPLKAIGIIGGVQQYNLTISATPPASTTTRFWSALSPGNSAAQAIGQAELTTAAATPLPAGQTALRIGTASADFSNNLSAPIARLQVYNRRLSDAQAAAIAGAL